MQGRKALLTWGLGSRSGFFTYGAVVYTLASFLRLRRIVDSLQEFHVFPVLRVTRFRKPMVPASGSFCPGLFSKGESSVEHILPNHLFGREGIKSQATFEICFVPSGTSIFGASLILRLPAQGAPSIFSAPVPWGVIVEILWVV